MEGSDKKTAVCRDAVHQAPCGGEQRVHGEGEPGTLEGEGRVRWELCRSARGWWLRPGWPGGGAGGRSRLLKNLRQLFRGRDEGHGWTSGCARWGEPCPAASPWADTGPCCGVSESVRCLGLEGREPGRAPAGRPRRRLESGGRWLHC